MLTIDRRQKRNNDNSAQTKSLQSPGMTNEASGVEQVPFPEHASILNTNAEANISQHLSSAESSPALESIDTSGQENRQVMVKPTDAPLPASSTLAASAAPRRTPVVIRGSGKKSAGPMLPPKSPRRLVVHASVTVLLIAILVGALAAILPLGNDGQAHGGISGIFTPFFHATNSKNSNTALIAAQAATATAVTQDGYEPYSPTGNKQDLHFAGVPSAPKPAPGVSPSDAGNLNRFFYGQCTYFANMRYHQLTGHWVPWLGNANQWSYGAANSGWVVSSMPNPNGPSIIVLQAGVQGAGGYGHVAVVESGTTSTSMVTSNWNWNGRYANLSYVTFSVGPGVSFVWYPG